jgi:hypothetical protein
MRVLSAFIIVAALIVTGLPRPASAAPIRLPHLVKTEEKICERKPDGVYCGKGLKKKFLFQCVDGALAETHACDWGCDPKGQACLKKPPRPGSARPLPPADGPRLRSVYPN